MMYCEREKPKTRQRSYVYESKTENEKTKEKEENSFMEMKQEQERYKQEEIVRNIQLEKERKIHYEREKILLQDFLTQKGQDLAMEALNQGSNLLRGIDKKTVIGTGNFNLFTAYLNTLHNNRDNFFLHTV